MGQGTRAFSQTSKKTVQLGRLPIQNHKLARSLRAPLAIIGIAVADIYHLEMEAFKDMTDVWVIVDADHHPALAPPQKLSHLAVISKSKATPYPCVCQYGGSM